jgi:hypothetical protein
MKLPEAIEYEYRFTEYDYEYDEIRCDASTSYSGWIHCEEPWG